MARDVFHEAVREGLKKDGWTITDDPLTLLSREEGGISTDLGAEKMIVAEKGLTRIAVEVKSFINPSLIHDFLRASGQYKGYDIVLRRKNFDRTLYLAMPFFVYDRLIVYDFVQAMIEEMSIKFILFDHTEQTIVAWKE
jgi:hypothetical protein